MESSIKCKALSIACENNTRTMVHAVTTETISTRKGALLYSTITEASRVVLKKTVAKLKTWRARKEERSALAATTEAEADDDDDDDDDDDEDEDVEVDEDERDAS